MSSPSGRHQEGGDEVAESLSTIKQVMDNNTITTNVNGEELVIMPFHRQTKREESANTMNNSRRDKMLQERDHSTRAQHSAAQLRSSFGMGGNASAVQVLSDDNGKLDEMMYQFEQHDDRAHITYSRRIVEKYLHHRTWYNPQYKAPKPNVNSTSTTPSSRSQGDVEGESERSLSSAPSLKHAWAYFEHITLPRRLVHAGTDTSKKFDRADPGESEEETALYHPWGLPFSELSQWGIGMGLYFKTLQILAIIFLVVGLANIVNMLYFMSPTYNATGQSNLGLELQGTAICTNQQWVHCIDCTSSQWDTNQGAFATDASTGNVFVERNACPNGATLKNGMVNYASMLFLIVALIIVGIMQKRSAQKLDENVLSATDYSICVRNPPPEARDPDTWREFFNQFESDNKRVTLVTIALANSELIYALLQRRRMRRKLQIMLGSAVNLDDAEQVKMNTRAIEHGLSETERQQDLDVYLPPKNVNNRSCGGRLLSFLRKQFLKPLGIMLTASEVYANLQQMEITIKKLQTSEYSVTKVFVTFETEAGQRNALAALTTSKMNTWFNRTKEVGSSAVFHGKVLEVVKPMDPSAVRWQDLGIPTWVSDCDLRFASTYY
jgi:hypothetical protein